jgi:C2 domain
LRICIAKTLLIGPLFYTGKGTDPDWNETFVFSTSEDVTELIIKLMDSDVDSDDFVGEAWLVILTSIEPQS